MATGAVQNRSNKQLTPWQRLTDRIDRLDPCTEGCGEIRDLRDALKPDGYFFGHPLYSENITSLCILRDVMQSDAPQAKIPVTMHNPTVGNRQIDCDQARLKLNIFAKILEYILSLQATGSILALSPEEAFTDLVIHEIVANLITGNLDTGMTMQQIVDKGITSEIMQEGNDYVQGVCDAINLTAKRLPQREQEALKRSPQYIEWQRCQSFRVTDHADAVRIIAQVAKKAGVDEKVLQAPKK